MKNELNRDLDLCRNNLDYSSSPYLLQHVSNPVWWQEWSEDLVRHAATVRKPLLVSVGYATCHWCHVMASGAFSDIATSNFLNEHFICIKVDREQRPDIDQYMMDFINKQNGSGGWPLNVFLTYSLNPVFALTYAPVADGNSMYSFLAIAQKVLSFIEEHGNNIPAFLAVENKPSVAREESLVKTLLSYFDGINGGFGNGQKFPGHSTLLYLLYSLSVNDNPSVRTMCITTLDSMRLRGLNDHLQGGIFRYCVDSEWTIPHFEKMLYDQAMALWTYSLAFRVLGNDEYRTMAKNLIRCLDECFEQNGFYISAHDADTDHEEGATYLWGYDELKNVLDPLEMKTLSESYHIGNPGNFEGKNHLIKRNDLQLREIEEKLLMIRNRRKQPSRDDKILCWTNALFSIALIQAGRLLNEPLLEKKGESLAVSLVNLFWDGNTLGHSYRNGILQRQGFLTDASYLYAALGMIYEHDASIEKKMKEIESYLGSFKVDRKWIESDAVDFQPVFGSWFDHPVPSGISMAEFGLARIALLTGMEPGFREYLLPFQSDFYNIGAMICNGLFHVITTPEPIPWSNIPVNSIQVRGANLQDCFMGSCTFNGLS